MLDREASYYYCTRTCWEWVFESVFPSGASKVPQRELVSERSRAVTVAWCDGAATFAANSHALDGCAEKDSLCRTLADCDALGLAPETALIVWTATELEDDARRLFEAVSADPRTHPVLKAPLGSSGDGVVLVESPEATMDIVRDNASRARHENVLLERLRVRGYEPCYSLQRQVGDSSRRTSVRVYVLWLDNIGGFLYDTCEARDARSVDGGDLRSWFLTNGNGSDTATRRVLESNLEETKAYLLAAQKFVQALARDFERRTAAASAQTKKRVSTFAFAGLDYMPTRDDCHPGKKIAPKLLEVNRAPAAPPEEGLVPEFRAHLIALASHLVKMVSSSGEDDSRWIRVETQ